VENQIFITIYGHKWINASYNERVVISHILNLKFKTMETTLTEFDKLMAPLNEKIDSQNSYIKETKSLPSSGLSSGKWSDDEYRKMVPDFKNPKEFMRNPNDKAKQANDDFANLLNQFPYVNNITNKFAEKRNKIPFNFINSEIAELDKKRKAMKEQNGKYDWKPDNKQDLEYKNIFCKFVKNDVNILKDAKEKIKKRNTLPKPLPSSTINKFITNIGNSEKFTQVEIEDLLNAGYLSERARENLKFKKANTTTSSKWRTSENKKLTFIDAKQRLQLMAGIDIFKPNVQKTEKEILSTSLENLKKEQEDIKEVARLMSESLKNISSGLTLLNESLEEIKNQKKPRTLWQKIVSWFR
jgi:hypothetical protein